MTVRDDSVREQIMQVGGRPLRVAIRPGTGTRPPLLLCNGIGMRLEALQPFVDALDPAFEVIRFDAPGTGGSQLPSLPYRFTTLALLLRKRGHRVAEAAGATEAAKALTDDAFDLMVTDLRMPEVDGMTLLRRAHELDPALPVIVITAFLSLIHI